MPVRGGQERWSVASLELDREQREILHQSLRKGIEQMRSGRTIDADVALAELDAHR